MGALELAWSWLYKALLLFYFLDFQPVILDECHTPRQIFHIYFWNWQESTLFSIWNEGIQPQTDSVWFLNHKVFSYSFVRPSQNSSGCCDKMIIHNLQRMPYQTSLNSVMNCYSGALGNKLYKSNSGRVAQTWERWTSRLLSRHGGQHHLWDPTIFPKWRHGQMEVYQVSGVGVLANEQELCKSIDHHINFFPFSVILDSTF